MRPRSLTLLAALALAWGSTLSLSGCASKYQDPVVTQDVAKPANEPPPPRKDATRGTSNEQPAAAAPANEGHQGP